MSHCTFYREREDGNYDYVKKNLDDDTEIVIQVMTPTEYEESQRPSPEVAAEDNRITRNSYLEETDWWCVSDRTATTAELNYRQALRDLPTHANWPFLEESDWPIKP